MGKAVQKTQLQKHSIRTYSKLLKRIGRCKVLLVFDRRRVLTFRSHTPTVERQLMSNLIKRVPETPTHKKQTKRKRNPSEAFRKKQFNKGILSLRKGNYQSSREH